jgi:hypothetical protein
LGYRESDRGGERHCGRATSTKGSGDLPQLGRSGISELLGLVNIDRWGSS